MKHTLLLCLLALSCFGQPRRNEPLPQVAKSPTGELSGEITGWSLSLDGQWMSAKNLIPYRKLSRDSRPDFNKTHDLGMDNMPALQFIPIVFGGDTLICLVKHMKTGKYELENIEESWQKSTRAHYFLFSSDQLPKIRAAINSESSLVKIDLLDNGNINDISPGKISDALTRTVKVDQKCQRQLILTTKTYEVQEEVKGEKVKTSLIRFQVHSNHNKAEDLQGVIRDFRLNGKSLYGTPELLDYLYYECSLEDFQNLLNQPTEFKLL